MKINFNSGFLTQTQNTILSAAFVLSFASMASAILAFLKNRLLAQHFGVATELAIFYTADKIPSLVYSVLVVGAVSTVFIPVFSSALSKNREEAFKAASSIINATVLLFLVIGTSIFFMAPQIIRLLSLGKFSSQEVLLGANLMKIMIAGQLILVVGSLATSILQSFKYFLVPALAPIVYNLGMIAGIIFLSGKVGIYGPAIGVLIGAFLHLGIQIPLVKKCGFSLSFSCDFRNKGFREILGLAPPRILSVFLANSVGAINNSLAILVSTSSVIFLKFADQLQGFPVSTFGLAIASAALPTLSAESQEENLESFKKTFLTSFHQMMFLVLPLSIILLVLRIPAVRIVYGVSKFPWEATVKTSYVLAFFSISIFAQSATYLITRAFYALKDTLTPVTLSLFTILINVLLSVFFVTYSKLGVWSVAWAYSITSLIDFFALFYLLSRKVNGFDSRKVLIPFVKIAYSTLLMGITLYIPIKLLDKVIFDTSRTINLLALTGVAGLCGMSTYLLLTKLMKVEEIELFYKLLRKMNLTKAQIVEKPAIAEESVTQ